MSEPTVEEALYTLHLVTGLEINKDIDGLKLMKSTSIDGKIYTSEWFIIRDVITSATESFKAFDIVMKQFRVYRPTSDEWCVIDHVLLQSAIENGYTIQI